MQKWFFEFTKEDTQLLLAAMKEKYQLSKEEYLNLIDILFYYFVVNGPLHTFENITFICNEIIKNRELIEKNQNSRCVQTCLLHFMEEARKEDPEFRKLEQFLEEGILFHSFNGAFKDTIQEKGLILQEKPWDLEEIERIRAIFQKYQNRNIFGYYQGRKETPIFFARNLVSSPYYGLSSPTFFRKFIENQPKYFNVFLNRDYDKAVESMQELTQPLSEEERKEVFQFFQKYWEYFSAEEYPWIAVSTFDKLGLKPEKREYEGTKEEVLLKRLLDTGNIMVHENIPRENLELFSYETFTFLPSTKQKNI